MKKKILALLTAIALCMGMLPSTVLADVENPTEDATTNTVMAMSEMDDEAWDESFEIEDDESIPEEEISGEGEEVTGEEPDDTVYEEYPSDEEIFVYEEEEVADEEPDEEISEEDTDGSLSYDDLYNAMMALWERAAAMEDSEGAEELWDELMALWEQIYTAEENGTSGLTEEERASLDDLTEQIYERLVELGYDPYALVDIDNIDSYTALMQAINGQTGTIEITLSASFATEGEEHITLESGAEVSIDLNGCTITADDGGNGALFTIPSGASLTIKDSQASAATQGPGVSVGATGAGQLASVTGSIENGLTLTYYVTESTVTNSATGTTQETRYPYTVNSAGMICTTGANHSLFSVTGGTLNIENGFIYGENVYSGNRAIDASSGTVNLSGGYICGFDEAYSSGHEEADDGGAVRVTNGAVLNISGSAVLAANKAATGGAVDVADGGTLNMTGGIISGNESTESVGTNEYNNDYGGGGIHAYGSGTTVNISGGYLTNNVSDCEGYFDGGGGILVNGGKLNFSGGYITGNKAASSGGGIRTAYAGKYGQMGSDVFITGGYLCANYAASAEGGGMNLDNGSYSEITATSATIYINNNETDTTEHWGGGGIFCAYGATLYMNNVLVTGNAAGGFGGGVAGCATGRIAIADDAGAAIYSNTAQGAHTSGSSSTKHDDVTYALNDPVFMANGYADYYCALESMVSGMMLGGGSSAWYGSADGEVIEEGSVGIQDFLWATYIMGLTADPSSDAIASAQNAANVYVTGNDSYTHGGGILSNGYLFMGNVKEYAIGDALEVDADKQLISENGENESITEGQFTFEITDEEGTVVSTGTTQSDGSIFFNRRLTFEEAGTFTFTIKETSSETPGITMDPSIYTLVVTVSESDEEIIVAGEPVDYEYFNITHITLTKSGVTEPLIDEDVTSVDSEVNLITIPSPAFVNYDTDVISITVHKIWQDEAGNTADWPADLDSIKVYLYQNEEVYGDPVLLTPANPSYTWTNLPTSGEDENGETVSYVYEVKEEYLSGYLTSYEVTNSGNTLGSYWVPLSEAGKSELTPGEKYLIVSPDGNTALSLTEGHIDAQLTSEDAASITPGEGNLTIGIKTYSSWYPDDIVTDAMTWAATTTLNYDNITLEHIILKNAAYTGSSLLVQGGSGSYTGLKGCNGDAWGSAMMISADGYLMGQYDVTSWQESNPWSYIIYADGRFNSSAGDATNAVKVYVPINPITETTDVNITNQYVGNTSLSGEKVWDDDNDRDGLRPYSVTVRLLANGDEVDSVTVTEADNWGWSFTDLPEYSNGEKIVYTVIEDAVDNYETDVTNNADGSITITNRHIPETVNIEGSKTWNDNNNQDGVRPKSITIRLWGDGAIVETKTVTPDTNGNWSWSFENLPKYRDGGIEIVYNVTEDIVPDYSTSYSNDGYSVTNEHTPDQTSLSVLKIWDDNNDQDGVRPEEITVTLVKNGEPTDQTLTLDENNSWAGSFTELDKYTDGEENIYTVQEVTVADYESEIVGDATTGYRIVNTHTPETVDVNGSKVWDDESNKEGIRPAYITIRLYADGEEIAYVHVTEEEDWAWSFTGLPKYRNGGTEIVYTITEDDIPYYIGELTGDVENGFEITNTLFVPKITKEIAEDDYERKEDSGEEMHEGEDTYGDGWGTWDDADNNQEVTYHLILTDISHATNLTVHDYLEDGLDFEPETVKIDLYDDGSDTILEDEKDYHESEGACSDPNGCAMPDCTFEVKFEDSVFEDISDDAYMVITYSALADTHAGDYDDYEDDIINESYMTFGVYSYRSTFATTETDLFGFGVYKYADENGTEAALAGAEFVLERNGVYATFNTETDEETGETYFIVSGWVEDMDSATALISGEDGMIRIEGLDDDTYTLIEAGVPAGYEIVDESITVVIDEDGNITVSGDTGSKEAVTGHVVNVENTLILTEVEGTKTWEDNDDQDGVRPESITIRLLADGEEVDSVTATEADGWSWSFTDLRMYKDGIEIAYTIIEDAVDDYSAEYDGYDVTNTHTPGQTSVSVTKVWDDAGDQDGIRPASVEVQLYADGEAVEDATLVLSEENNWTGSFTELDIYRDQGIRIEYTVEEAEVPDGYECTIEEIADSRYAYTVTNAHTPETTEISGTKTWDDNDDHDGKRPDSIMIRVLADGVEVDSVTVTAADGWSWSVSGLDKYRDGGVEIVYSITEDAVDDYTSSIEGFDITNSYVPEKISIPVSKVWDDDDENGVRPKTITVKLLKNGVETGETLTLRSRNGWAGTFTDLEKYTDGMENVYTVEEEAVENYTAAVSGDTASGYVITNSYTPEAVQGPGPVVQNPDGSNPDSSNPDSAGGTKTGDTNMIYLWSILIIAAATLLVVAVALRTRRPRVKRR